MYLCFLSVLPLASLSVVQTSFPPSISPPLSHRPSSVFCSSSFPPEEDRAPLSPGSANTGEACFLPSYRSMCGQACVPVCTLLIHSIAGILWHCCPLIAYYRPLKGGISKRFLVRWSSMIKYFMFCFASVNPKLFLSFFF